MTAARAARTHDAAAVQGGERLVPYGGEVRLLGDVAADLVDALPWPAVVVDECGFVAQANAAMRDVRPVECAMTGKFGERFPEYAAALRGNPPWLTAQEAAVAREIDARVIHERVVVRPIPGGACILVEDVTRMHELEMADAQTARLASLGFMLAGACHEISNPLTAIYSMVQMLRASEEASGPEMTRGLAHIAQNVQRLLEISQRLCGFSRVGDEPPRVLPVDEPVEESLALLRQSGQLEGIDLVRESQPQARVMGHAGPLREVFHNILLNAVQAMEGRGRLVVRTRVDESGGVEVAVHDSGPGLSAASMRRLFEPFFTTKGAGKGTGLGLSISNEIVQQHGGRICVENDAERGAWFFIRLPGAGRAP